MLEVDEKKIFQKDLAFLERLKAEKRYTNGAFLKMVEEQIMELKRVLHPSMLQ